MASFSSRTTEWCFQQKKTLPACIVRFAWSESRDTAKVLYPRFPKTFLAIPHAFHGLGAAVLSAVMLAACAPTTPNFEGRASVIDGDTLEIHGQRTRLWGCDAPENRQLCNVDGRDERCGRIAGERLAQRVADRVVSCIEQDVDRYGRSVTICRVDDEDLGAWLVREGFAVRQRATPVRPI